MPTTEELIKAVLAAPAERREAIFQCALGNSHADTPNVRPGSGEEAAKILGCCHKTLDRYARRGWLKQIRISPRRFKYDLNEVAALALNGNAKLNERG